jgi:23S rRNA-/tRNA-specific pseudouridylate synthase
MALPRAHAVVICQSLSNLWKRPNVIDPAAPQTHGHDACYSSFHFILLPAVGNPYLSRMEPLLNIIYEDADLLVVNKPAGLVCHPTQADACGSRS